MAAARVQRNVGERLDADPAEREYEVGPAAGLADAVGALADTVGRVVEGRLERRTRSARPYGVLQVAFPCGHRVAVDPSNWEDGPLCPKCRARSAGRGR
jgi:hypothetical protein